MMYINDIVVAFNTYAKEYQVIAGAVSLWGLGVLSYFSRNIPRAIWDFVRRQSTTSMTIINTSKAYHDFLEWLIENKYTKNVRSLKITSGKWGDDKNVRSIGYGTHRFLHKLRPFQIHMTQIESPGSSMERDQITITALGRSHKFFDKVFVEIDDLSKKQDYLKLFKYREYWERVRHQRKRSIDSIFLDEGLKEEVFDFLNLFIEKEDWYLENGIPYHTGILLYGVPGSGKTSLVKAIASELRRELYILSSSWLYKISDAVADLPENCILLIEDIDTDSVVTSRSPRRIEVTGEAGEKPRAKNREDEDMKEELMKQFSFANLSDVLNSIDGIIVNHGRLLIATTNHREKLDSALLRNGRFDLKIEMGYTTEFVVKQFFNRFYPDFTLPDNFKVKDDMTSATIQFLILKNLDNPGKVLREICEEEENNGTN